MGIKREMEQNLSFSKGKGEGAFAQEAGTGGKCCDKCGFDSTEAFWLSSQSWCLA
jgi:hypothetical protein